jgi:hypothetical protein
MFGSHYARGFELWIKTCLLPALGVWALSYVVGCAPVDCELNPNQPECRGESEYLEEEESELSPVDIARGKVHGDRPIAKAESALSATNGLPTDLWFIPSVRPDNEAVWSLIQTMTRWVYVGPKGSNAAVYRWENATPTTVYGRNMPVGTICQPPLNSNTSTGLVCKIPGDVYRYVNCPNVRIGTPIAYTAYHGAPRAYDFANRFLVTERSPVYNTRIYLAASKTQTGQPTTSVVCVVAMTGKTVTVQRR